MLNALRQRLTSDRFDARLAEWVAAGAAVLLMMCGVIAVDRLGLGGAEFLVGFGLILGLALLFVNMAVLFSIRAAIEERETRSREP
jgi:hypothetical protein